MLTDIITAYYGENTARTRAILDDLRVWSYPKSKTGMRVHYSFECLAELVLRAIVAYRGK